MSALQDVVCLDHTINTENVEKLNVLKTFDNNLSLLMSLLLHKESYLSMVSMLCFLNVQFKF